MKRSQTRNNEDTITHIYTVLHQAMGERNWWPASTVYEMMVGAILVQNTSWKNVDLALKNFGENLNPFFVDQSSEEEIAILIRPSGFHHQKAKKVKALTTWYKTYDFDITKAQNIEHSVIRQELLNIHGVGSETADCIMVYALNKCSFVIDAYAKRVLGRYGLTVPNKYESVQKLIEESIARDIYIYKEYHALLVEHCQTFCKKKNPSCNICPLKEGCKKDL